jgi:hypothetical protein
MTLDVTAQSQERKTRKVSKIDLVNRRYSNPNDLANDPTTLEADT